MRSDQYIVEFEKSKDYTVFSATNVFVNVHEEMFYLDFFLETVPFTKKFTFEADGTSHQDDKPDLLNIVYATAGIPKDKIPALIELLSRTYENAIAKEHDGDEDDGEEG